MGKYLSRFPTWQDSDSRESYVDYWKEHADAMEQIFLSASSPPEYFANWRSMVAVQIETAAIQLEAEGFWNESTGDT